ncbi:MAG: hypothetical protein AB8G23_04390 [Myxococcota bacterium]
MDRESVERLRFDRRLARRRGWLEEGQYDSHVNALDDVTDKMTTIAEEEEAAAEAAEAEAAAPAPATEAAPIAEPAGVHPAAPAPAPVAGDFSTPGTFAASTGPGTAPPVPIAGTFSNSTGANSSDDENGGSDGSGSSY